MSADYRERLYARYRSGQAQCGFDDRSAGDASGRPPFTQNLLAVAYW